jgi:hypothetical protein
MPRIRTLLTAALVALAAAAPAQAATKQRVGGFVVTWPVSSGDTVAAGTALRVVVRPTATARRAARVEVRRLTDARRVKSAVVRRTARRRTVVFRPAAGARYRLRVTVGRRSAHRTIATAPAEPSPPVFCGATARAPSATLTASSSTARPGETLTLTLLNTGSDCLRTSATVSLRRPDGTNVPLDRPIPAAMYFVPPGATYTQLLDLPTDLPPGAYRAVMFAQSGPETEPVTVELAAELTVTP